MAADVGSLIHRTLSWGDDQQNIYISGCPEGLLPDLPIQHIPDADNDFSRQIYIGHTQTNHTLKISVDIW